MNEVQKITLDDMINDFLSKDLTYWIDVSKEYECYENPFSVLDEMSRVMEDAGDDEYNE